MRNEEYAILVNELQADPLGVGYASMTDDEVAVSLNEPRFRVPTTRFITWRAIAAVLDDDEYGLFKQAITAAAQQSPKVADMLRFLEMPCSDDGTTGGIDFGNDAVRSFIVQLCDAMNAGQTGEAIKQKLLGLAEVPCSRLEEFGIDGGINERDVALVRTKMSDWREQ